jgi:hypothetical protein
MGSHAASTWPRGSRQGAWDAASPSSGPSSEAQLLQRLISEADQQDDAYIEEGGPRTPLSASVDAGLLSVLRAAGGGRAMTSHDLARMASERLGRPVSRAEIEHLIGHSGKEKVGGTYNSW